MRIVKPSVVPVWVTDQVFTDETEITVLISKDDVSFPKYSPCFAEVTIELGINAEDGVCTFVDPGDLTSDQREIWVDSCLDAEANYGLLEAHGVDKEKAILLTMPRCLEEKIYITSSVLKWTEFLITSKAMDGLSEELRSTITRVLAK